MYKIEAHHPDATAHFAHKQNVFYATDRMIKNGRVHAGWSQTQIENMFMMYCVIHEMVMTSTQSCSPILK